MEVRLVSQTIRYNRLRYKRGDYRPAVRVDYGFWNCKSQDDERDMEEVYKIYFHPDTNPVDLHNAAIQGNLFEYVGKFVKLQKKLKKLMVNPYPLPNI